MQLMMPAVAVLEIAPAKVLQGAVRLHGSASLPTPDTQVRVACAWAGAAYSERVSSAPTRAPERAMIVRVNPPLLDPWATQCTRKRRPAASPPPRVSRRRRSLFSCGKGFPVQSAHKKTPDGREPSGA